MTIYQLCHDYLTPPDSGIDCDAIKEQVLPKTAEHLADQMLGDEQWMEGEPERPREAVVEAMRAARLEVIGSAMVASLSHDPTLGDD